MNLSMPDGVACRTVAGNTVTVVRAADRTNNMEREDEIGRMIELADAVIADAELANQKVVDALLSATLSVVHDNRLLCLAASGRFAGGMPEIGMFEVCRNALMELRSTDMPLGEGAERR